MVRESRAAGRIVHPHSRPSRKFTRRSEPKGSWPQGSEREDGEPPQGPRFSPGKDQAMRTPETAVWGVVAFVAAIPACGPQSADNGRSPGVEHPCGGTPSLAPIVVEAASSSATPVRRRPEPSHGSRTDELPRFLQYLTIFLVAGVAEPLLHLFVGESFDEPRFTERRLPAHFHDLPEDPLQVLERGVGLRERITPRSSNRGRRAARAGGRSGARIRGDLVKQ